MSIRDKPDSISGKTYPASAPWLGFAFSLESYTTSSAPGHESLLQGYCKPVTEKYASQVYIYCSDALQLLQSAEASELSTILSGKKMKKNDILI